MGRTPLQLAAWCGQLDICKIILEHIDDANPKDNAGQTPFLWAAEKGHFNVCQLIIEKIQDKY